MKQKNVIHWISRAIICILIVANIFMIFKFSSENGQSSSLRSEYVADKIAPVVDPEYTNKSDQEKNETIKELQFPVRKLAHMAEYASLAFLVCLLLITFKMPLYIKMLVPTAVAFICAMIDELISQTSVDGRFGTFSDVMIDSTGALIGMLLAITTVLLVKQVIFSVKKRGKRVSS